MISLNIATHKAREQHLKMVLKAVEKQNTKPDVVNIYLNDYKCPEWIKPYGFNVVEHPDGDLGASAKFYFADKQEIGVYITLDDDLIANPGYVGYMADMVYKYPNSLIGLHGTTYGRFPIKSYYTDASRVIHYCVNDHKKDSSVDMLGSGVLAFKIGLNPTLKDFPISNMTDPYVCKWAKENGVTMVCLNRGSGFVKEIEAAQSSAIWKSVAKDDTKQTAVINSIDPSKFNNRKPLNGIGALIKSFDTGSLDWGHLKCILSYIKPNTKVVEFGSGKSTDVLSRYTNHLHSFEHNKAYAHKSSLIRPIDPKTGWYSITEADKAIIKDADVLIVDAPIGSTGQRYNLPIELLSSKTIIFVDDCHREKDKIQAEKIAAFQNRKIEYITDKNKILGIIR